MRSHKPSLFKWEYLLLHLLYFFKIVSNALVLSRIFFLSPAVKYCLICSSCSSALLVPFVPCICLIYFNISILVYLSLTGIFGNID